MCKLNLYLFMITMWQIISNLVESVTLLVNVNWNSFKFTQNQIVSWNVWPTWLLNIAIAARFSCQVRSLNIRLPR